jgi:hypothetical protein
MIEAAQPTPKYSTTTVIVLGGSRSANIASRIAARPN